jgi:hypothetical protein
MSDQFKRRAGFSGSQTHLEGHAASVDAAAPQRARVTPHCGEVDAPRLVTRGETHTDTEQFRTSSARVNLSVPSRVHEVLRFLSRGTGQSKASFVMEALNWYLPRLEGLALQFGKPVATTTSSVEIASLAQAASTTANHSAPRIESRAERRRREKELRKLAKRNHGNRANGQ